MNFKLNILKDNIAVYCKKLSELQELNEWVKREGCDFFYGDEIKSDWDNRNCGVCVCYVDRSFNSFLECYNKNIRVIEFVDAIDIEETERNKRKVKVAKLLIEAQKPIMLTVIKDDGSYKDCYIEAVNFDPFDKFPYVSQPCNYKDVVLED